MTDKADALVLQADKKLKGGFFSNLVGGSQRFDEAADLYNKAGNLYKLAKKMDEAAEAYKKAAAVYLRANSPHDAAGAYANAANCIKKHSPREARACLQEAVEIHTDGGRFSLAAKLQKDIAEMCEAEDDLDAAMDAYQKAADFYEGENSPSAAKSCLVKVATFAASKGDYAKAIEIFEQLGTSVVDDRLLKWGARDYFFKAGLCHLAQNDLVASKRAVEKYKDICATFSRERECELLEEIIAACENYDVEAFTQAVAKYDSITKIEPWKVDLLVKIKNNIKEEDNDALV
jgi:alpha-soluble NSF attachment protein